MIDRTILIRRLSFSLYFVIAFLTFLVFLFPFECVKARLESEMRTRTQLELELNIAGISPRFINRFVLADVVVSDSTGRVLFESPSVRTHVSLFGFLRGLLTVNLKVQAYGGSVSLRTEQGAKRQYVSLDADGLDIGSYALFKNLGLKLSGKLGGSYEATGDAGEGDPQSGGEVQAVGAPCNGTGCAPVAAQKQGRRGLLPVHARGNSGRTDAAAVTEANRMDGMGGTLTAGRGR